MGALGIFKFAVALNIFFLVSYTIILIATGAATDGELRVGLLSGFGTAQGYAVLFSLYLLFIYFTPDALSSSHRHHREIILGIIGVVVLYLFAIIAVIITGSQMDGYWRTGLVVGGSIALVHYFGFILAIICMMGVAASHH